MAPARPGVRPLALACVALLSSACAGGVKIEDAGARGGPRPGPDINLPATLRVADQRFRAVVPFPRLAFDRPVSMFEEEGRIYVAEQGGRIWSFLNDPGVEDKTLVLDISEHTQSGLDGGLLAIVPHPNFGVSGAAERGDIFLYYLHSEDPIPEEDLKAKTETYARLSRVTIPAGELTADAGSELVLIEQLDRNTWHMGSGMFFHPVDGFLYLAIGDEGGFDCIYDACQRIDRSLFGGVIRIDVDMRGGDVSHPIRRSPVKGVTDHYFIPSDNPFVDDPDVLEEFYAIGLRNPHRMTYDSLDGVAWIGEVGQRLMEEINVLSRGANYQWDFLEGTMPAAHDRDPVEDRLGVWTPAARAYPRMELRTIIGGHVYRGDAMPELYGRYVFANYVNGQIWAASYGIVDGAVGIDEDEVILEVPHARDNGITSFGQGEDGRLYFLTLDVEGAFQEIVSERGVGDRTPPTLSETGLFHDLETLTPVESFIPYQVNAPLWSDGARKRRWLHVPQGSVIGFEEDGEWRLPDGTVLLKHFELALDERQPEERTRLETRVLVLAEGGMYGMGYRWHDDQRDATIVPTATDETLSIVQADGSTRLQTYHFPSPSECLQCHDPRGARSLGLSTRQLNGAGESNSLIDLVERGLLEPSPDLTKLESLPRLPALADERATLEDRARAYLDANCSHCHGIRRPDGAHWDARFATALAEQGIVNGPLVGRDDVPTDFRIVVPGDRERSVMWLRTTSTDADLRMPPLATSVPDPAFRAVLEGWIDSLADRDAPASAQAHQLPDG